jgi:DNA-binding PadR family transcriptional regulator
MDVSKRLAAVESSDLEEDADAGSSVAWLILGLIIEKPSHGYELYKRYEARYGRFLPLSRSNVYSVLGRLRGAEMVEEVVLDAPGPARKQSDSRRSHRATRAGAVAYRRWVAERVAEDPQLPQILGQIASARLLGLDGLIDVLDRYEHSAMQEMKALPTAGSETAPVDVGVLVDTLIADKRRRDMRARLDWANYARRVIRLYEQRSEAERS